MNRRIVLNALTTCGQTVGSAAVLFLLYRFLIRSIGIERVGIWSLVLATTSVVWLANQGFSASLVRFVARYSAREQPVDVSLLIQTAVISMALAAGLIACALYPAALWFLHRILPPRNFPEARAILPFALFSLWFTVIEAILQAALSGRELIAECNYLEMAGSASYLLLALALVPRHGLPGLACAQAVQSGAIVLITWVLLCRRVGALPPFPRRWSRAHFRELAAYGLHFQIITASQALREPVTKALITKFGGLAFTGLYDLAARAVMTLRETIAQANQVLIPTVASLSERDPASVPKIYRESYRLVFFLAVPAFACLAVASPLISRVWIGRCEPAFVEFVVLLSAAWLVNVLCNSAYVLSLGTGALRWVSTGCVATVILNCGLGFLAGRWAAPLGRGGIAVGCTAAFSLAIGYVIVLVAHHCENGVPFSQLWPEDSAWIVTASCAASFVLLPAICFASFRAALSEDAQAFAVVAALAAVLLSAWIHPMRKRVIRWVFSRAPV
ncbi:MAG TPA: lipopolysaccharide biosynthesis protein [Verrucomicrobiae bacterium]|nr:lipopolysaccharide biosynthesis protein [Verrucomicrobiae bacterium]